MRGKTKIMKGKETMNRLIVVAAMAACVCATTVQGAADFKQETPAERAQRMKWWTDARFGMFIHWGLYAMPARHEWVKSQEKMTDERYARYFENFDPDRYNPRDWARRAKAAGMKYMVLTTKHHDGFCLWDSAYTDYKATNTPAKRDLVREFVDAVRAEGLHVGFYYSLPDWHHPDAEISVNHPQRPAYMASPFRVPADVPKEKVEADFKKLNEGRNHARYLQYVKDQLTELLTKYGQIDLLWFDGGLAPGSDKESVLALVRKLQPQILVNNRLGINERWGFDFGTPEQINLASGLRWKKTGELIPWEACHTFSGSWGYHRDEATWADADQLIDQLVQTVSVGGNLIMNVGPTARGDIDARACARLDDYAKWMEYHSKSIYGCTQAPEGFEAPRNTLLTYNPERNRIYMHVLRYPKGGVLEYDFDDKVRYAHFLHDNSEVKLVPYTDRGDGQIKPSLGRMPGYLRLPATRPDVIVPVIEMFLK